MVSDKVKINIAILMIWFALAVVAVVVVHGVKW